MAETRFGLALVGVGMRGTDQITMEQLRTLQSSTDIAVAAGVTPSVWRLLETFSARLHDAGRSYVEGADRATIYQQVADMVVRLAEERGQTSFVQYGHPLVYSRPSRLLIAECRRRGIVLRILPGISSIDEILCVLELDIRDRDIQIFHAEHLFQRKKAINPHADLILMHAGLLGERAVELLPEHRARRDTEPYRLLQSYLLGYYPQNHEMRAILLSPDPTLPHEILESTVGGFAVLAPALHGHTLYIRGLGPAEE